MEVEVLVLVVLVVLRKKEEPSLLQGEFFGVGLPTCERVTAGGSTQGDASGPLGNGFVRICFVDGPSGAGCGRACFDVVAAGADSTSCRRAERGGFAGVVGVGDGRATGGGGGWREPGVPTSGGAFPRMKPDGMPLPDVGGAFFAIEGCDVGACGSLAQSAP